MGAAKQPVYVIGGGSIGAFLAAQWCRVPGVELIWVVRDAAVADFRAGGLKLSGSESGIVHPQVVGWSELESFAAGAWVFVTPKAYQLGEVLGELVTRQGGAAAWIFCQNGLGILEDVARASGRGLRAPQARLIFWFGARLEKPSTLHVAGEPGRYRVDLAYRSGANWSALASTLSEAGLKVSVDPSIVAAEWKKALWNLSFNGLGALLEARNGEMLDNLDVLRLARGLFDEARQVAEKEGVAVSDSDWQEVVRAAQAARENYNSMLQDLWAGRPTELPWLNGRVVERAKSLGISVPLNEMLVTLVAAREKARSLAAEK